MSRSGYVDDDGDDPLVLGRWRGAVKSAIGGKRGQVLLHDLLAVLDAMPKKTLVADSLVNPEGEYCTLGVLGARRGIDLRSLDPEDYDQVAAVFGVNAKLVQEIVFENDEQNYRYSYETRLPADIGPPVPYYFERVRLEQDEGVARWQAMRAWVAEHIKAPPLPSTEETSC